MQDNTSKTSFLEIVIIFALVVSFALFYFRGNIADKDFLKSTEPAEVERLQYLNGEFNQDKFHEPNSVGYALLLFPIYKILGDSLLFYLLLKFSHVIFLFLAILILYRITSNFPISMILLAYPFTHVFNYHTNFDLFLIVFSIYLLINRRTNIFYWISIVFPLFRPEMVILPLIVIFVKKDLRWLWVPLISILLFMLSQYVFYGNPLWQFTYNVTGNQYNFGTTGLFAMIVGMLVALMTILLYAKDAIFKRTWMGLFAVCLSLTYLYFFLIKHISSMDRFGFYLLPFLVLRIHGYVKTKTKNQ